MKHPNQIAANALMTQAVVYGILAAFSMYGAVVTTDQIVRFGLLAFAAATAAVHLGLTQKFARRDGGWWIVLGLALDTVLSVLMVIEALSASQLIPIAAVVICFNLWRVCPWFS